MDDPYLTNRSLIDPNYSSVTFFDNSKPREERDFKEIYPDLDEAHQLNVFVLEEDKNEDDDIITAEQPIPKIYLKNPTFKTINKTKNYENVKFSKLITEYGFQEPNRINSKKIYKNYIRPFSLNKDSQLIEDMINKKKNQVEYDMDEQDYLYLQNRNNQSKNTIKITPEIFEIMITILENEWNKLELEMNSISSGEDDYSNKVLTLDQGTNNDKYGNDDGIVHGSFYEQKCAICNESDCDNSNAIVFCDGCDIAVHQECYGIAFIPEGQWLCRKCMISKKREVDCVFCPSKTGAFKQLDNSLWSHVICALWINELYFANPIYMEPIEGVDLIPKNRWKLTCYICKQKVGACIQCSNRNCFQAYHVTCARRAGLYMQLTKGIQGAINNKATLKSYCDRHGPSHWDQNEVIKGINKTRLFFRDMKILNDQNAKLSRSQKTANKLNIFKWKTENNTPIPPKIFSDRLFQTLVSLKVENQISLNQQSKSSMLRDLGYIPNRSKEMIWDEIRNISNEICRYWCLKRESKKGAPLIRKNNNLNAISSILYGNNNYEEISDKIEFANVLINDLNKVVDLTHDNLTRQILSKDIDNLDLQMIDTIYFPIKMLIDDILNKINAKVDSVKVIRNYKPKTGTLNMLEILRKNSNYKYSSVQDLSKDIDHLYQLIVKENKPTNNIFKLIKKWLKEFNKLFPNFVHSENLIKKDFRKGHLNLPFIQSQGKQIKFHERDPKQIMDEYDLSEVEDLPESETDNQLFENFLNAT